MLIFDADRLCSCLERRDDTFTGGLVLPGPGLWVGLVSSGHCTCDERLAGPGDLFVGPSPLTLHMAVPCHLIALRLGGAAADLFSASAPPLRFLSGASCPDSATLVGLLASGPEGGPRRSAAAYALLCELAEAEDKPLPALVSEAISLMREDYATLYGVEELSAALGVSKSHLIRVFSAAMGVTPGHYLTSVRLSAAKALLLSREYTLDLIAGLCGFSGANYFCRVFRRVEGKTPAAWRAQAAPGQYFGKLPLVL